jgi:hypothetical protein
MILVGLANIARRMIEAAVPRSGMIMQRVNGRAGREISGQRENNRNAPEANHYPHRHRRQRNASICPPITQPSGVNVKWKATELQYFAKFPFAKSRRRSSGRAMRRKE